MRNVRDPHEIWDEFKTKQHEPQYIRNVVSGLAGIMLVFTAAFFICALVVASIENAGFNVVLTGLLLAVWEVGTMWLMKKGPHETSLGFLIGVTMVMYFITIMTAIYWGQLSDCDSSYDGDYDQYSCDNKSAMRGVAAFASIIWIMQLPFLVLLVQRRQTLTKDDGDSFGPVGGHYDDYGDGGYDNWGGASDPAPTAPKTTPGGAVPGETSDL